MKSLKSKVILSALVLIFALVATIGSTFAWFTVSNTVATSNISLNVVSTDSLLIKLASYTAATTDAGDNDDAAIDYSTSVNITQATLLAAGYTTVDDYADWRLNPVTAVQSDYASISADPANLHTLDTTSATNPDRELGAAPSTNSSLGGSITLRFWVMSQSAAVKNLVLSDLGVVGTSLLSEAGNTAVEESLRIGVFSELDSTGFIYGDDIEYEYVFTDANLTTFYGGAIYGTPTLLGFNKIDDLTLGLSGSGTALTDTIVLGDAEHGVEDSSVITTLAQNTPELITVTMFLDGWDADASDLLNTIPFYVNFKFTIA